MRHVYDVGEGQGCMCVCVCGGGDEGSSVYCIPGS